MAASIIFVSTRFLRSQHFSINNKLSAFSTNVRNFSRSSNSNMLFVPKGYKRSSKVRIGNFFARLSDVSKGSVPPPTPTVPPTMQPSKISTGPSRFQRLTFMPNMPIEKVHLQKVRIVKPFFFAILFTYGSFAACAIWEGRKKQIERDVLPKMSELDLKASMPKLTHKAVNTVVDRIDDNIQKVEDWFNAQNDGRKLALKIAALNFGVLFLWKIRIFNILLRRYFSTNPSNIDIITNKPGPRYWPLVLSTFSHYSVLHFAANMYVLDSFCQPLCAQMGREQVLGIYLASGVFSSWLSYAVRVMTNTAAYSLGASGAILGLISVFCLTNSDAKLSLIFLPQYPFSCEHAIVGIAAFDFICLVLRFRLLDHAAHLGGTLFGAFYVYCDGEDLFWNEKSRERYVVFYKFWRKVKKNYKKIKDRIQDPLGIKDDDDD